LGCWGGGVWWRPGKGQARIFCVQNVKDLGERKKVNGSIHRKTQPPPPGEKTVLLTRGDPKKKTSRRRSSVGGKGLSSLLLSRTAIGKTPHRNGRCYPLAGGGKRGTKNLVDKRGKKVRLQCGARCKFASTNLTKEIGSYWGETDVPSCGLPLSAASLSCLIIEADFLGGGLRSPALHP